MRYISIALAALVGIAMLYYLILLSLGYVKDDTIDEASIEKQTPVKAMPKATGDSMTALFSHADTPRFTFSYPQFENWETEVTEREIRYEPHETLGVVLTRPPAVKIDFVAFTDEKPFLADALKNPHDVPYKIIEEKGSETTTRIIFDVAHPGGVFLELTMPRNETRGGFNSKVIYNTIIATLRKG